MRIGTKISRNQNLKVTGEKTEREREGRDAASGTSSDGLGINNQAQLQEIYKRENKLISVFFFFFESRSKGCERLAGKTPVSKSPNA